MDLVVISIIISSLAFVISVFGLWDNRSKTKIMNEQLTILKEQSESKQGIRNAARVVVTMKEKVSGISPEKYAWGTFVNTVPSRLLAYLHDSGKKQVEWAVDKHCFIFSETIGGLFGKVQSFDSFRKMFEQRVAAPSTKYYVEFTSTPRDPEWGEEMILEKILVEDYVKGIFSLKIMVDELKGVEKEVNLYDPSIIEDIEKEYLKVLNALYERLSNGSNFSVNSDIKTRSLPEYLLKFVAFDVWKNSVEELKASTCQRLCELQRRLQEAI